MILDWKIPLLSDEPRPWPERVFSAERRKERQNRLRKLTVTFCLFVFFFLSCFEFRQKLSLSWTCFARTQTPAHTVMCAVPSAIDIKSCACFRHSHFFTKITFDTLWCYRSNKHTGQFCNRNIDFTHTACYLSNMEPCFKINHIILTAWLLYAQRKKRWRIFQLFSRMISPFLIAHMGLCATMVVHMVVAVKWVGVVVLCVCVCVIGRHSESFES